MIQLRQQVLILCHSDGRMEPLDMEDLVTRLSEEDGLKDSALEPWIIEQVVENIIRHFKRDLGKDKIPFSDVINLAQSLLKSFYREIILPTRHTHVLDLFQTAKSTGAAFELAFFEEVRRFLLHRADCGADPESQTIYLTGLRRCAKFLSGCRRWGKRCSGIQDEIVTYIREEAVKTGVRNLSLAVLS